MHQEFCNLPSLESSYPLFSAYHVMIFGKKVFVRFSSRTCEKSSQKFFSEQEIMENVVNIFSEQQITEKRVKTFF